MLRQISSHLIRRWRWILVIAQFLAVIGFLISVGGFYQPDTDFTRLIAFGSRFAEQALPEVRVVPHVILENPDGYDGQFYVQVAMDPMLRDPALQVAIDNFNYRARQILMPAVAHIVGMGRPAWVLQADTLLNVVC
jgi:hypothetical protein